MERSIERAPTLDRRTAFKRGALLSVAMGFGIPGHAGAQTPTSGTVTYERDVVYGEAGGQQLLLDIAVPPGVAKSRPTVVLIHGGSLTFADKSWYYDTQELLAAAGYVVFNINYRLFSEPTSPNVWPAQLDDAQRAVRWIRANAAAYGVDPERVGAWGHSSGAHLAAFLGTRDTRDNSDGTLAGYSSRVACVIDMSGEMDFSIPFPDTDYNATNALILGGTDESPPDQAAYRDFSPISFVDEAAAPFLILHALADQFVPFEQPRRMADALHLAGIEVMVAEFPGADHLGLLTHELAGLLTIAFLDGHLHPAH
jgi:acetyl esterase/lipase